MKASYFKTDTTYRAGSAAAQFVYRQVCNGRGSSSSQYMQWQQQCANRVLDMTHALATQLAGTVMCVVLLQG
jgi:hypothetical protein